MARLLLCSLAAKRTTFRDIMRFNRSPDGKLNLLLLEGECVQADRLFLYLRANCPEVAQFSASTASLNCGPCS